MKKFENLELPLKERREAFLNDLVNHYNTSNRCTSEDGFCYYYPGHSPNNTEGCAIGRHLMFDKYDGNPMDLNHDLTSIRYGQGAGIAVVFDNSVFKPLMPEWLRDLGKDFLISCQFLHDVDDHWNSDGMTHEGECTVARVRETI